MDENKQFEDITSSGENSVKPEDIAPVEAEKKPEAESTGFDFPKPPKKQEDYTYHYVGEEIKKDEPVHTQRYYETVEKPAQEPKAQPFNPYQANPTEKAYSEPQKASYTPPQQSYNYVNSQQTPPQTPKTGKGKKIAMAFLVLCLILAAGLIGAGIGGRTGNEKTPQVSDINGNTVESTVQVPEIATTKAEDASQANSVWVAEKVRPGVVGVMTYVNGQLSGEGSGVLWMEKEGYTYVITCAHVIDAPGVSYGVLLLDGRSFEAKLVGADTRTDIGVLKLEGTGLPLAELGDSSSLKIGEPVYAIGNPGGSEYFGSLTDGIVSAIDRSVTATYKMTCIQHNAAINPGNSGGALVNTAGQIVGINSSKIADTEYEGMGFAVPTSIAKPVAEALVNYGYVPNRPKLGIEYADVNSYQLYSMVVSIKGLPQGSLVIAGISPDSSLADTEAQVGDLIIGVNGKDMNDSSVLLDLIETGAVGDTLTLTLCRVESRTYKTTTFDVTITLVEDKGTPIEETTTQASQDYYYGGASDFEDFFNDYFGFGW